MPRPQSEGPDGAGGPALHPALARVRPDDVASAPPAAVARLSEHLQIPLGELRFYGERKQTRTGHLREVTRYLNWKPAKTLELKELDEFLLARAMEHDSPSLLFRLACEHLAAR